MKRWHYALAFWFSLLASWSAHGIELESLRLNYKDYFASSRDPLLVSSHPKESMNLQMNVSLGRGFFWDNWILSETDPGGYRVIAWNLKLGVKLLTSLDLQYEHKSTHLLDGKYQGDCGGAYCDFPVEDSVGLVWTIFKGPDRAPAFQ